MASSGVRENFHPNTKMGIVWDSIESLTATKKVIFAEYGIPCRLMSDAVTNFVSDRFRTFCSRLNIKQAVL